MNDPLRPPRIADEAPAAPGQGPSLRTLRWVKAFGVVVLILVLAFVASLVAGVRHGPGLHAPSGSSGHPTPPAEQGVEQP